MYGDGLPILIIRFLPDERCTGCGQLGYVDDKSYLCAGCLNINLLRHLKRAKVNPMEVLKHLSRTLRRITGIH